MSASRQFNRPLLNSSALAATHNSNTIANIITTGGNIGVGTNSPDCNLHLYSSSTEPIIGLQSANQSIFGLQTISDAGSAGIKIGTYGAGSISSNVSFFSKIGNVGIGTTSPMYKLDVMGSGDFSTFVTTGALYSTNQTTTNIVATASTITNLSIPGTLTVVNITSTNLVETNITAATILVTGGSLRATFNANTIGPLITTGGNVGIRTTSPTSTLDVFSNLTTQYPIISRFLAPNTTGGTSQAPRIIIGISSADSVNMSYTKVGTTSPNNLVAFGHNNVSDNQLVLLRKGNIGIGTVNPQTFLHFGSTNTSEPRIMLFGNDNTKGYHGLAMGNSSLQLTVPSSGSHFIAFGSNTGGNFTEQMRIQNNGNVGIGTTSPATKLDIKGTLNADTYTGGNVSVTNITVGTLRTTTLITTANLTANNITVANFRATSISMGTNTINFNTGTNVGLNWGTGFSRIYDDGQLHIYTDDNLYFNIGGNDRLYINNNGVGVYSASVVSLLCVNGDANGNGALQVVAVPNTVNSGKSQDGASFKAWSDGNNILQFYNSAGGYRGGVNGNGSGAVSYATSSDRRLKDNVVNISNATQMIKQMRPVEFTWKSDNRQDFGFIAQEIFELLPTLRPNFSNYSHCECTPEELSNGILCTCEEHDHDEPVDKDGKPLYYGLDYGKFTPYITKALQETIAELETSQQKIQTQENTISQLQSQIALQQQQIDTILSRLG